MFFEKPIITDKLVTKQMEMKRRNIINKLKM